MTTQPFKLGFIGLGIMGAPMAGHLIKAGHQLFVCTHGKVPEAIAGSSATICVTARGVAERADIVFVMVPDTPDVEAGLVARNGVAARPTKGKVVVGIGTIFPPAAQAFRPKVNAVGSK